MARLEAEVARRAAEGEAAAQAQAQMADGIAALEGMLAATKSQESEASEELAGARGALAAERASRAAADAARVAAEKRLRSVEDEHRMAKAALAIEHSQQLRSTQQEHDRELLRLRAELRHEKNARDETTRALTSVTVKLDETAAASAAAVQQQARRASHARRNVSRSHFHTFRVGGHRPAQGPSAPQIGSQRLCIRG